MSTLANTELGPAILDRARGGDHEAFAAVVRLYDAKLRGLAFRVLGDRDRMDDALQEAYVRAFRALPRFRGDARMGTWLFRITYNACLDELGSSEPRNGRGISRRQERKNRFRDCERARRHHVGRDMRNAVEQR